MSAGDATRVLDAWPPGSRPPRAHAADAPSAHAAADRLERSGRSEDGMRAVLEAVRRHPGHTSKQLAAASGLDRHDVAKRLSDLFRRGVVERIEPAEGDLVWFPGEGCPAPRGASHAARRRASAFAAAVSWDAAIARARVGFRRAGREATLDDLQGAAGIERRLAAVYAGRLVARLRADGRVETSAGGKT